MAQVFTADGARLEIGRLLGRGGEGSVFEIPALATQVAKLYHKLPDSAKQAKLVFMAQTVDEVLLNYVAWPQKTLHSIAGGPVVGFLMPKINGRDPVHMVYSPAHRRQEKPKAAWDFLLFTARNTAAAFEALHTRGHVAGDVNQGNVMVGGDSKVVLIDSDSFQVNARGRVHLCEVGVSHFTPPELQGLTSFDGVVRTANHDNFGLGLLIFHLLFGGRHPYSGIPLKDGVGDALEADIRAHRYAYARDARNRGIAPPPRSIPLATVPDALEAMFELSFTEKGSTGLRPTAKQWVEALDRLRGGLRKCSVSSIHVYPNHVEKCPWCALEQQGVVYFLDLGATYTQTASGFVLAQVWALIEAVAPPPPVNVGSVQAVHLTPKPLPDSIPSASTIVLNRVLAALLAIVVGVLAQKAWLLGVLIGAVGWWFAGNAGVAERRTERGRRHLEKNSAQQAYEALIQQLKIDVDPKRFHEKRAELLKLRDEHRGLPDDEKRELDKLQSTAQQRQMQKFLDTFFIDAASIPGLGLARKAALRSFGIETAADVHRVRVSQVKGFGEGLTRAVLDWRASCERRFIFNPSTAISDADRGAIRMRIGVRRASVEAALRNGPAELTRLRNSAIACIKILEPRIEEAALKLAQANKDLEVV